MDDDLPPAKKNYPLTASKMSKTPSWVMLGFVAGAATVHFFFRPEPRPAPAPVVAKPAAPEPERTPGPLSRIEAVFEQYGKYATWADDTTEVALWDPALERYADFYEIRRIDGKFYFRTIPMLTRVIVTHGVPTDSPLQFTETEEQYREWFESIPPVQRMWKKPPPPPQSSKTELAPPARVEVERPKVPVDAQRPNIPGSK